MMFNMQSAFFNSGKRRLLEINGRRNLAEKINSPGRPSAAILESEQFPGLSKEESQS